MVDHNEYSDLIEQVCEILGNSGGFSECRTILVRSAVAMGLNDFEEFKKEWEKVLKETQESHKEHVEGLVKKGILHPDALKNL